MEELVSSCRMLHSHHAKYLIQLESILNSKYGYIPKTIRDEKQKQKEAEALPRTPQVDPDNDKENIVHVNNNNGQSPLFISSNQKVIINPLIGQPLNRLSEGDIETDIGSITTSGSTYYTKNGISTPGANTATSSIATYTGTPMTSPPNSTGTFTKSLAYIQNDIIVPPQDLQKIKELNNKVQIEMEMEMESMKEINRSPSSSRHEIHDIEMSYATKYNSSPSMSMPSKDYSQLEDEYLDLLKNHRNYNSASINNQSQETSMDLLEENDEDFHDADDEDETETYDEEEEDDEDDFYDATTSIASTVVCERKLAEFGMFDEIIDDINKVDMKEDMSKQNEKIHNDIRNRMEEIVEASHEDSNPSFSMSKCSNNHQTNENCNECEENNNSRDNVMAAADSDGNSILSNVEPTALASEFNVSEEYNYNSQNGRNDIDKRTGTLETFSIDHIPQQQQPHNEEVYESPLDKFKVQFVNGGQDVKVVFNNNDTTSMDRSPIISSTSTSTKESYHVTSPLDRFQVQVMNNGTEVRVSPVENDVLNTIQSPINKITSPSLHYDQKSVNYQQDYQIDETMENESLTQSNIDFMSESPSLRDRKVYPKTPIPMQSTVQPSNQSDTDKSLEHHVPSSDRTPLAREWIEKNISGEKERLLQVLGGGKSKLPSGNNNNHDGQNIEDNKSSALSIEVIVDSESNKDTSIDKKSPADAKIEPPIHCIYQDEYNTSPRVVQIQVTFDELNRAINVLNDWILSQKQNRTRTSKCGTESVYVPEKEANELLENEFNPSRKAKSLLMSLCFFRRISLQLSAGHEEKHYVIPLH